MKVGHYTVDKNDIKRFTVDRLTSVDIRVTIYFYSGGFETNLRVNEDKVKELEELINNR
jgi:hypothetical protein